MSNVVFLFKVEKYIKGVNAVGDAMLRLMTVTNKEIYILNKFKRVIHAAEVRARKAKRK